MSYIRCLSNPEGLHIIGTVDRQVEIFEDPKLPSLTMPVTVFEELMRRWLDERMDVRYRGASLIEQQDNGDWRWLLSYKGWSGRGVLAYTVTWFYVASNVVRQDGVLKRLKAQKKRAAAKRSKARRRK